MQNENANFEFLIDQLREITAERNNLRGLVDDVRTLQMRNDILTCFKKKAFEILKKRAEKERELQQTVDAMSHALSVAQQAHARECEELRRRIPNPDYVSMDSVAKNCQDISTTLEIDRLGSKNSFLRRSLERAREVGTTWRRRCQDLYSTIERVRLENERLKLQIERMQKKESFIKAMES